MNKDEYTVILKILELGALARSKDYFTCKPPTRNYCFSDCTAYPSCTKLFENRLPLILKTKLELFYKSNPELFV